MLLAERISTADELAAAAGIVTTPASWQHHWAAFQFWYTAGNEANVRWTVPEEAMRLFDLPPAVLGPLSDAMIQIDSDSILKKLATFWHFLVYGLLDEIGENTNDWPLSAAVRGVGVKLLSLAVLVSGTDQAIANSAAHGMDDEIARASLAFIGQRVREVRQKRNQWGIESLGFLRHYVRAQLFRLGRLTFRVSSFSKLLDPDALRVEVHVAGGSSLDPKECAASYRAAMNRFPTRHPQQKLVGFTCISWLLDPALRALLPDGSNILHFAEPYQLLDLPGDHRQAYDLIFGDPDTDPPQYVATHPGSTTLQRAIARHVEAGGAIRSFTGFLPWDVATARFEMGR